MADKDLYAEEPTTTSEAPAPPLAAPSAGSGNDSTLAATLQERAAVAPARRRGWNISIGTPRVADAVLTAFLRQLVMKLDAGVPLLKGITTLAERTPDRHFRDVILDVGRRVEGGTTLWQAFDSHPREFDNLFVNLVKAGETSGTLTGVLSRVAEFRQKKALLRRQIRGAMTYPAVILVVTLGILVLFLTLVLPGFEDIFGSFELELPAFTRAALAFSRSIIGFWYLYLLAIGGAIFAVRMFISTPQGRLAFDRFKMRGPIIGDLVTKAVVADFTRTFSTLLGSGVSILETLDLARDAIGNRAFSRDIQHMRDSIEQGEGLEPPLRRSHLMPAIVTDMLVTGEESGALEGISRQVAVIYEAEVDASVAQLKNLIEPVVILVLGIVVGGLCLSFFLPYVTLVEGVMAGDLGPGPGDG